MATKPKVIGTITHDDSRKNIPTAEYQAVMKDEERHPVQVAYERRNRDLDPQLVWRGKDEQDASPLVAQAPPLYIQEKVHPKVLIDSLKRYSKEKSPPEETIDLFADFNGVPEGDARTEFYQHEANWSNRMILGDSLHVMASLAEREGLRGRCSASTWTRRTGSNSTRTSSGRRRAVTCAMERRITSPASPSR